ncbi:MAG: TIGR04255 family protein [Euryarchaeota archaeon]|nr:TIGR04255 family protein [Euryarchaeota archaeon]
MPKYKKDYLTNVICRIDFIDRLNFSTDQINRLKDDISEDFPDMKDMDVSFIEVMMGPEEDRTIRKKGKVYEFAHEGKLVRIEPECLVFEFTQYTGFDQFKKLVKKVLNSLDLSNNSVKSKRIGLRYINQIHLDKGDPFDWKGLIVDSLVPNTAYTEDKNVLSRSLGWVDLTYDDFYVRFHYGMFNSEHPNPIARKEFVLDFDCYTKDEQDLSDVPTLLNRFHEKIKEMFECSILGDLRQIMGVE